MPANFAPHALKVRVREIATGVISEVAPVDARERVTHPAGGWEYVTDDATGTPARADTPQTNAVTPAPVPQSIAERLAEKSAKELKTLAKKAGISGPYDRDTIIAALIPHIEGKTVSIDDVKGLPPVLPAGQFPTQAEG